MDNKKEQITQLFTECLVLRTGFNEIEKSLENIHEIAMNASVAAGQTGSSMRIFSELANQISQTVKRMSSSIPGLRDEVNYTMNAILRVLVIERRLEKYLLALPDMRGQSNLALLQSNIERQHEIILGLADKSFRHLHVVESLVKTLMQHYHRLYASREMLKMEASNLLGTQAEAIWQLAENLEKITDDGSHQIRSIAIGTTQIKNQIRKFKTLMNYGERDAKALAV